MMLVESSVFQQHCGAEDAEAGVFDFSVEGFVYGFQYGGAVGGEGGGDGFAFGGGEEGGGGDGFAELQGFKKMSVDGAARQHPRLGDLFGRFAGPVAAQGFPGGIVERLAHRRKRRDGRGRRGEGGKFLSRIGGQVGVDFL